MRVQSPREIFPLQDALIYEGQHKCGVANRGQKKARVLSRLTARISTTKMGEKLKGHKGVLRYLGGLYPICSTLDIE